MSRKWMTAALLAACSGRGAAPKTESPVEPAAPTLGQAAAADRLLSENAALAS